MPDRSRLRLLCATAAPWLGLFISASPVAAAQELIGIDLFDGVYSIDPKTGAAHLLGFTGLDQQLWHSMAKHSDGRLYSAYGAYNVPFAIYEIDPGTAQAAFRVQTNLNAVLGMAFGPGDVLFAVQDTTAPLSGGPDDLYSIDLLTGLTTRIGPTGFNGIQALAYGQGALWGWDNFYEGLIRIDPWTGAGVDVNPNLQDNGYNFCQTLSFSDDGALYGAFGSLFLVDTATGTLSYVGTPAAILVTGMEFLPGQLEPFSLGLVGATGGPMGASVAGATPGASVAVLIAAGGGGTVVPAGRPCAGTPLDLARAFALIQIVTADALGRATLGPAYVPPAPAGAFRLQALDLATCSTSNVARVVF